MHKQMIETPMPYDGHSRNARLVRAKGPGAARRKGPRRFWRDALGQRVRDVADALVMGFWRDDTAVVQRARSLGSCGNIPAAYRRAMNKVRFHPTGSMPGEIALGGLPKAVVKGFVGVLTSTWKKLEAMAKAAPSAMMRRRAPKAD